MRAAAFVAVFEILIAAVLFGAAGRVDLPWVWALLAVHAVLMSMMVASMDPDLRRERLDKKREGGGDRRLRGLIAACILAHLVLAGLDVRRGWSPAFPAWVHAAALAAYAAAVALSVRAMTVNRFFAPAVRIQSERGHETVTAGPYRFVRHPGYAGMVLAVLAESVVFGSLWALAPAAALAAVVAWRTAREDRMLRAGLRGYAEYASRVRYRLVPAVW